MENNNLFSQPGFSFLICPDSVLSKEEQERQIEASPIFDAASKRVIFWGDEGLGPEFWEKFGQIGLLSQKNILILRHAEGLSASIWKDLSRNLSRTLEHVWVFLYIENDWEKGKPKIPAHILKSPCFEFANKKGWIWQNSGLTMQTVSAFIASHAKPLNIPASIASRIAAQESFDANAILNQLEKISLLLQNGKYGPECLELDAADQQANAFNLLRQIQDKNLIKVWREISGANDSSLLFFSIAIFASEFKTLWKLGTGEPCRLYPGDAARKKAIAQKLGLRNIANGFAILAETEHQVKSGLLAPDFALENMVIKLAALFSKNR